MFFVKPKLYKGHLQHRSMLKILCNPFLRSIGFVIVSVIDQNDNFLAYEIRRYRKGKITFLDD